MSTLPLAEAVGAASWDVLLPPNRTAGDDRPSGHPVLRDALALAPGHWLGVVADAAGRTYGVPLVGDGASVRRARPGDGTAHALAAVLAAGSRTEGRFAVTSWTTTPPPAAETAIPVDQTNESVVVGEQAVVKWTHLVTPGPHPAPAVLERLVAAGFTGTPEPAGLVQWTPDGEPPRLVVSVDAYLAGAEDGWTWAKDDLRTSVESGSDAVVRAGAARTGELVARMHLALAESVRPSTAADVEALRAAGLRDLDDALAATNGDAHALLRRHETRLRRALALAGTAAGTPMMLCHGDLHVGQVLRSGERLVVVDFDGNPVVPAADRLRPESPALDVAGYAQSLHHVGLVLRHREPHHDPAVVRAAAAASVEAFLVAYRTTLAAGGRPELLDESLLAPLRLRQVCREFTYAARHLPRWGYVPAGALPELMEGPL